MIVSGTRLTMIDPAGRRRARRERNPRARWLITDEFLRQVATVYAVQPSVDAIRRELGPCGHSTAARWLSLARARGFVSG